MGKKKDSKGEPSEAVGAPSANGTNDKADVAGPSAADVKAAAGKAAETTKQIVSSAAAQATTAAGAVAREATQAGQVLQQAAKRRGPTDVALLLSVINSAVLLLLLVGLGTAATLARSGDLQAALDTWLPASSVGDVAKQGLFALSAKSIDGVTVPLKKFAGNLTIVTNTATGDHARNYTNVNFDRLNYLYSKYRPQGLQILAFPSNQFGNMELAPDAEIKKTVQDTHGVEFPLFAKVDVRGPTAHPVWKFLIENQPADHGYPASVDWNFNKFIVSKYGFPLVRFPLTFDDEDLASMEGWIRAHL
mmetsp:Transcript_8825/g.26426  ORF Transcript_8825/g.26426 Transcript_8825/m.26426 type:complete len:305 (-) Transcript_8825:2466-3380(-)